MNTYMCLPIFVFSKKTIDMVIVPNYGDYLLLFLTEIGQISKSCQSMSLGQNVKITHEHIFVFANNIFSDINPSRYDNFSHLWKFCTFF